MDNEAEDHEDLRDGQSIRIDRGNGKGQKRCLGRRTPTRRRRSRRYAAGLSLASDHHHLIIIISQSFLQGCQQRRCGQEPAPGRTVHWNVTYNAFKCKDNKWIQMLGLESARHLPGFLAALGLEDSGDHDRLQTTTVALAGPCVEST